MKTNLLLCLFLCAVSMLASCRETDDEATISPSVLTGKWEFIHIEDKSKTILPVTDAVTVKLELTSTEPGSTTLQLRGNNLVNLYSGSAIYTGSGTEGNLMVTTLASTKMGGETKQMEFDAIYLSYLANATSYKVTGETLTILAKGSGKTEGQTYKLIFKRQE